jgi:hypothetical protein
LSSALLCLSFSFFWCFHLLLFLPLACGTLFRSPETCAPSSVVGRRRGEGVAELGRCLVIL